MSGKDFEPVDFLKSSAGAETVDRLFELILGRSINDEGFKARHNGVQSVEYWINRLLKSDEFREKFVNDGKNNYSDFISDEDFRTPSVFKREPPTKVLITGSCLTDPIINILRREYTQTNFRHIIFNNTSELEDIPTHELEQIDFQVAQIGLRTLIADSEYMEKDAVPPELLERIYGRIGSIVDRLLKYSGQIQLPVFLLNLAVPQENPLGMLMNKPDLSNFCHIVELINKELARHAQINRNLHIIDFDAITASLGKRYILDDVTSHTNHGSFLSSTFWKEDIELTPHGSVEKIFGSKMRACVKAIFNTAISANYILGARQKIKVVIFDLDGTLWRGVLADTDDIDPQRVAEGWPLGILDAASFLKKRGILLAIASKNDPDFVKKSWEKIYGKKFSLTNFSSIKVGWRSKVDSVYEILSELNLLPENCLFVDDNPLERDLVSTAFPAISTISGPVSTWRRTLLWAAELQVPCITDESRARAQSFSFSQERIQKKKTLSEQEYLEDLNVEIDFSELKSVVDKKFERAFELLNKTNQFNTTGQRWSFREISEFFVQDGVMVCADISDRLSDYGLTAVALIKDNTIKQIILSCRVFGLGVEYRMLQYIAETHYTSDSINILFRATEKNGPAKKFLTTIFDNTHSKLVDERFEVVDFSYPL